MRQLVITKSITPRDYKSLDKYFNEIDKINMISTVEEVTLARRIKNGDNAALERLTKTNLRFVVSVAKQYRNNGLPLGDLISEGNIGLMIAAKRYDETKGFKFISYAVWWIRQSIIAAIAEHSRVVRLPYSQYMLLGRLNKVSSLLEQKFERKPSDEELAEFVQEPLTKIRDVMRKTGAGALISEPLGVDDNFSLLDVLPSNEPRADCFVVQQAIMEEINISLKILSKRDREVLLMFFGLGAFSPSTLEEIGRRLNLSKEHVSRLKEKALIKLRNCSYAPVLKSCLS